MMVDELLELIATADPADTAMLDEIDARVWCFLNNWGFWKTKGTGHLKGFPPNQEIGIPYDEYADHPLYTRSRDALKAIRPKGWYIIIQKGDRARAEIFKESRYGGGFDYTDKRKISFSTLWYWEGEYAEELAELHVIIQAIQLEQKSPN